MIFKARIYDTKAEAVIAYQHLMATEARLPTKDRFILHLILRNDADVVVMGWKKKDKSIDRIKDGHWIGGDPFVLLPEEERMLDRMFKAQVESAGGEAKTIKKEWSPNELGLLDDEGNIK